MENIKYHTSRFLSKAEYSFHFHECFSKLDKLSSLEQVDVFLFEEPIVGTDKPRSTSIQFSDDWNICTIKIPFTLYYQHNNKLSLPPTPKEVFDIDRKMATADEQHKDEF